MKNEKFLEAVNIFGKDVVDEVIAIVNLSDPDTAAIQFEDDDLGSCSVCRIYIL